MKDKKYILIVVALAVGASWFLLHKKQIATHQQQVLATNEPATATQMPANNSTAQEITNNGSNGSNAVAEIDAKYNQGLISKDQAVQAVILDQNNKSLDIYGKVVDQYGEPVAGARVEGSILLNISMVKSGGETHTTQTDSQGCFNFLGIQGVKIGILPQKEGYFYNQRLPSSRPGDYTPAPNNPVVFTMWKIHGAEPLTSSGIYAKIPHDGTPTTFDIATGKKSEDGDFQVTLLRSPLEIQNEKFDWVVKIEMLHGGLVEENDPYPYLAPDASYQPIFEFNVSSNDVPWHPYLDRNFYVKNAQGQYGVMKLHVNGSVTPARLKAGFTVNPSGSRNLEPDFSK